MRAINLIVTMNQRDAAYCNTSIFGSATYNGYEKVLLSRKS